MLRNLHDLQGYSLHATDGDIGQVKDFYIDDQTWVIRYLVVETGGWLSSRKVLISPIAIGRPDWQERILPLSITRQQVSKSPNIDTDKPVSRQHESQYLAYYAYPPYWSDPVLLGVGMYPNLAMPQLVSTASVVAPQSASADVDAAVERHNSDDTHLRSCNTVTGYHIHASDGEIGHVQTMLFDEQTWAIRYLVVNTSDWWIGHHVLITPEQISDVSWFDGMVSLNLTRQKVKGAPPYDASFQLDRMNVVNVYKHYGNMAYWVKEQVPDAPRASAPR